MNMIKPKKLVRGSTIAIISPSSGCPYLFPDVFNLGLANLKEYLGLNSIEMPTARMLPDGLYRNPQLRAEDINAAFSDPSVDGIICSIGGDDSVRILQYLNTQVILNNPKVIIGFSDATTFLSYLNQLGMVTFYGPSVMAGFAQLHYLPPQYAEHLVALLSSDFESYSYRPYPCWTNGYIDWSNKLRSGECTEFNNNDKGWTFLQGDSDREGRLWGGCIEVLDFLKSTEYYPGKDFWDGRILFFETSEEKPSPNRVGYMLRNYGIQGVLKKINGAIFGRPKDYTAKECEELNTVIRNVFTVEFGVTDVPIVVDVDFGHTDPKIILPLGCRVKLSPLSNEITLLESPFR